MTGFGDLAAALTPLDAFPRPWFVCGGWAIDLFLGEVTRAHEDLEVGVLRRDQLALRSHLDGWELFMCARPGSWDVWAENEPLDAAVHQVLARAAGSGPPAEPWEPEGEELQFFLLDAEGDVWVSRRDARLRRPLNGVFFHSSTGIPAVAPEIQLLYKAKHHLAKDEHDFRVTVARLDRDEPSWLRRALELVHPGDPWLEQLG